MKFSYLILSLLLLSVLATAVERRHRRHRQKLRTRSTSYVLLCDAGSSKTECSCFKIDSGAYSVIVEIEDGNTKLGKYYSGDFTADQYVTGIDDLRKQFAQKAQGSGKECGTSDFYLLSTAGSREAIHTEAGITTAKDRKDKDDALISALSTKFSTKFKHLEVISGRFEGFFGFLRGYEMFNNLISSRNNMVYYECGGMSCQVAWETNVVCKDTFWESVKSNYNRRFKKLRKTVRAKKLKKSRGKKAKLSSQMKATLKSGGVMEAKAIDGNKFYLFSKSWLGTGVIKYGKMEHGYDEQHWLISLVEWFFANKKHVFLTGNKSLKDVCKLDANQDGERFAHCYAATKLVLISELGSKDVLGDSMKYQASGVTAQYACDKNAKGKDPKDNKKEISYAKSTPTILVQSKALTSPMKENYQAVYEWDKKGVSKVQGNNNEDAYKLTLGNLKVVTEDICGKAAASKADSYGFQDSGCLVLCHYYTMFKDVVGLGDDSEIVTSKEIKWIQTAHQWMLGNAGSTADMKWPFPNVNKQEDENYTQQ